MRPCTRLSVPTVFAREEDLVRLKKFLTMTIDTDPARTDEPRPLLRASASNTLERGFGFCGERSTAILLLGAGGVRAHRLYIEGERWGHVAVEHEWDGRWTLFDAHDDPHTVLPDALVCNVPSDELEQFRTPSGQPVQAGLQDQAVHKHAPPSPLEQREASSLDCSQRRATSFDQSGRWRILTGVGATGLFRARITRPRPS